MALSDSKHKTLLDLLIGDEEHPALIAPDRPLVSYKKLKQQIVDLAAQLNQLGIGRGDRIAIAMPNSPEMVVTFLAATMCGTAAPLNPKYSAAEFAFYYEDLNASALIVLDEGVAAAKEALTDNMILIRATLQPEGLFFSLQAGKQQDARSTELARSEDIAMILHTSGTTSRPKRVPIRHRNLAASAGNIIGTYNLTTEDRSLCVMPLFHVHGLVASMLSTLASGGTVIVPVGGFNALEFWKLLADFEPTWYSAVPTMHQLLLSRAKRNQEAIAKSKLRFIRSSSSSLPPVVLESVEKTFNAPVLEAYSMTEASHQMTSNPLPPAEHKAGTVGYGFGVEVGIMDEAGNLLEKGQLGEIVVKAPNVVDGYENNPEANAKAFTNGWFRTGDQGVIDESGYLSLTGRLKELINRGGEKISPLEVDNVILRNPAVDEVLTFAAPHKTLGEDVHAAVVLKETINEKELKQYCLKYLADFKVPRKFHFLEALPRGATGKPQRLKIAESLGITAD